MLSKKGERKKSRKQALCLLVLLVQKMIAYRGAHPNVENGDENRKLLKTELFISLFTITVRSEVDSLETGKRQRFKY
jgi:hypothetical protein